MLEVGCFSEEAALRLAFPAVAFIEAFFLSGALYTKGSDVGIVGVMIDFVADSALASFRVITPV